MTWGCAVLARPSLIITMHVCCCPSPCLPLQDTGRQRSIAAMRSFGAFQPLQEFSLESAQLFARLLLGELSSLPGSTAAEQHMI